MTTSNMFTWVDNVLTPNGVMNLQGIKLPADCFLGAASWIAAARPSIDSLLPTLQSAYGVISRRLESQNVWLLIGTSSWQPDTRLMRYRRLWGSLKARGIELAQVYNESEVMCEEEGRLKFFGAAQVSQLALPSVAHALMEERCSYLLSLPEHLPIDEVLGAGWSGKISEEGKLLAYVNRTGGVLVTEVGEFDDTECGFVAIANRAVIKQLAE